MIDLSRTRIVLDGRVAAYKITIENLESGNKDEIEFEKMEYKIELGFYREHGKFGRSTNVNSNGHLKLSLKAWSGCKEYHDFKAEGKG